MKVGIPLMNKFSIGSGGDRYTENLIKNMHKFNAEPKVHFYDNIPKIHNEIVEQSFYGFYSYFSDPFISCDIIHQTNDGLYLGKSKSPKISTIYDNFNYTEYYYGKNKSIMQKIYERYWKLRIDNVISSDMIIAISGQTKKELIDKYDATENKIKVIPLGIDERFSSDKIIKKSNNYFNIGYIGSIYRKKNLQFLFKSLNFISDKNIRINLYGKKYDDVEIPTNDNRLIYNDIVPENKIVKPMIILMYLFFLHYMKDGGLR
jgi:glycosyltransferase involved in cell wall biosynthesis